MTDDRRPEPADPRRAVTDDWDWQVFGACRGMDVELFYHPAGERRHTKTHRINEAKDICAACPVIKECAQWALKTREPYGVWGGLSENERAAILGVRSLRYPGRSNPPEPTSTDSDPTRRTLQPQ